MSGYPYGNLGGGYPSPYGMDNSGYQNYPPNSGFQPPPPPVPLINGNQPGAYPYGTAAPSMPNNNNYSYGYGGGNAYPPPPPSGGQMPGGSYGYGGGNAYPSPPPSGGQMPGGSYGYGGGSAYPPPPPSGGQMPPPMFNQPSQQYGGIYESVINIYIMYSF